MKKILLSFLILITLTACNKEELTEYEKLMKENEYIILDVRTPEEYNESHVKESINIQYDTITEDVDLPKDKMIFIYCKSGRRSAIANDTLKSLGYKTYDMGAMSNLSLEIE